MTVNVVLITSEAIIFGCDSISSATQYKIDPFKNPPAVTDDGKWVIEYELADLQSVVTSTWTGVTKMFQIHSASTPVVAVTAGLAMMCGQTMNSLAHEFHEKAKRAKTSRVKVHTVANDFLRFLRKKYEQHYEDSPLDSDYWQGPEFLVGGYGRNDAFPTLLKIDVKKNTTAEIYSGGAGGLAWNGQASAVQRFIMGFDDVTVTGVSAQYQSSISAMHKQLLKAVIDVLNDATSKGYSIPRDLGEKLKLPAQPPLQWRTNDLQIEYNALPLQTGIDLVTHLVNSQSGLSHFSTEIPTVGGRTHIGVLDLKGGFRLIDEPELTLTGTGFDHE